MNHIDDELLNKYIDNELNSTDLTSINEHLKKCDDCLIRLKALRVVDTQLKTLEVSKPGAAFTLNLMNKINMAAVTLKPKKFYFFRFIFSLFILLMLGILILVITNISSAVNDSPGLVDYIDVGTSFLLSNFKTFAGKINISLVGSVISIIFFISMYLIYDSHRRIKSRLDRL